MFVTWFWQLVFGLVLVPSLSVWRLWWAKWNWNRVFSEHFGIPSNVISPILHNHFDVITSLVSMEHGVYGCEKVTSLGEVTSNGLA
jgi:hypothetical protein